MDPYQIELIAQTLTILGKSAATVFGAIIVVGLIVCAAKGVQRIDERKAEGNAA